MKQKKRIFSYSSTARQRKELARTADAAQKGEPLEVETEEQIAEKQIKRTSTRRLLLGIGAVALASVLILTAIFMPYLSKVSGNPIAVFNLSNGKKIRMELKVEDSPYACINFIYLASNGFYDGTIFHDISNGYVTFGGYTNLTDSKDQDKNFIAELKGFTQNTNNISGESKFKLGYRLSTEERTNNATTPGYMVMICGNTSTYALGGSTHFAFVGSDNASLSTKWVNNNIGYSLDNSVSVMGRYYDEESLDVIRSIYSMERASKSTKWCWHNPIRYDDVRIKSVTIGNIDIKVKKTILANFEDIISGTLGGKSVKIMADFMGNESYDGTRSAVRSSSWRSKAYNYD